MTLVSKLIRVSWSEEGVSEGGRGGGGGGGGRVAVTHSPGSVCNQAAEAGGSIRPSLSSAPACTSKTCVISNHTWKQERLGHAHAHTHTHTVRCVRSNPHKLITTITHAHTFSAGCGYCSHCDSLGSFVVRLCRAELRQKAASCRSSDTCETPLSPFHLTAMRHSLSSVTTVCSWINRSTLFFIRESPRSVVTQHLNNTMKPAYWC